MAISIQELMEGQRRLAEKDTVPLRVTKKDLAQVLEESNKPAQPTRPLTRLARPETQTDEPVPFMKLVYENAMNNIRSALGIEIPDADTDTPGREPVASNQQMIEEFSRLVLQQQDLMLDATKEQIAIFKKLEESITKLKDLGDTNNKELRKSIDSLTKQLASTPKTKARETMERVTGARSQTEPKKSEPGRTKPVTKLAQATPVVRPAVVPLPSPLAASASKSAGTPMPPAAVVSLSSPYSDLFADAGLISSESEGDKVQTGEREVDMASILGFFGSMMGGGDTGGVIAPGMPGRSTPSAGGKPGAPAGPYRDRQGRWRDAKGRYTKAPTTVPKTSWWEKTKDVLKGSGSKVKTLGTSLLEAGSLAKSIGIGSLLYSTELGNGELSEAERKTMSGSSPDLQALEARHQEIQAEMYKLVTDTTGDRDTINARIKALNEEAARNVSQQNKLKAAPVPAAKPDSGVMNNSLINKDLIDNRSGQSQTPVIINNTQNTVAGQQQPQFIAPSPEVRPREDALNRYIFRGTKY